MSNTIDTLREELFKTLRALNDRDSPMDLDRAKAVADVGDVIIKSAKVEVDYIKATGGTGTGFITPGLPAPGGAPQPDPPGLGGSVKHFLK